MEVASYLKAWLALQPPLTRDTVQMHHFMETPYSVLAQEFEQSRGYALEAAFLNSRFAEYFAWTGNLGPRGLQLLVLAADGLESQLGHTHRKTLAARDALATGALVRGFHKEAAKQHQEIRLERAATLGSDHRDVFMSMSYECLSNLHLLRLEDAQSLGEEAAKGLLATGLPSTKGFLHNQLYLDYTLEAQGKTHEAMGIYEETYSLWMKLNGPNDPSTLMTQSAMASTYRKLGRLNEAERHYTICFAARQRAVGLDNYVCIDLAISLSYAYWELQRKEEALALMELCCPLETLQKDESFERFCQIKHLQAKLVYDDNHEEAEQILTQILETSRSKRPPANRETMWIRLTLAHYLRSHGKVTQASNLFKGITKRQSASASAEELTTTEHTGIAENAVRLMKAGKLGEAKGMLKTNDLMWVREGVFEIIHGGPLTDTAWSKTST